MKTVLEDNKRPRRSASSRLMQAMGLARPQPALTPDRTRVYAMGDIHGRADLLDMLHDKIGEDAQDFEGERHLVYLGDFIDRGSDSRGVVDRVMRSVPKDLIPHYIKGNHDAALLDFLEHPETYRVWRGFGAGDTLLSYGVRPPLYDALGPIAEARDALQRALPAEHLRFFQRLELSVSLGDYVFVHAGVRPGVPLDQQSEEDLLWIREEFLTSKSRHEKVVVHGHTPMNSPVRTANRISVDTGAYATGILTAAVLEGASCRFLQARK